MFKSKDSLFRLIVNFLLGCGLFWFFQSIGWFTISGSLNFFLIVAIVGVVNMFTEYLAVFLMFLASPLIAILACLTAGLAAFLIYPLLIYFTLYFTSSLTHLFTMNVGFWGAVMIGAAFGLLRFSEPD